MSIPQGPSGIWLEYADGTRYDNVPSVYLARDEHGVAVFEIIPPRDETPTSAGVAFWPPLTAVQLPTLAPGSEIP